MEDECGGSTGARRVLLYLDTAGRRMVRAGKVGRRAGSKSRRWWQGEKRHRDGRSVWEEECVCVVGLYVRSTILFVLSAALTPDSFQCFSPNNANAICPLPLCPSILAPSSINGCASSRLLLIASPPPRVSSSSRLLLLSSPSSSLVLLPYTGLLLLLLARITPPPPLPTPAHAH